MKVSLSKEEERYIGQAKTDAFYTVIAFLRVAESIRNFSVTLAIFLRTLDSAETCFGVCEITLSISKPSALTHLHGSLFSSWCILGLRDVSRYTYPCNLIKPITSGYYLHNNASHIFIFYPDLSRELEIYSYTFNFFLVSLGCLSQLPKRYMFKNKSLFPSPTFSYFPDFHLREWHYYLTDHPCYYNR